MASKKLLFLTYWYPTENNRSFGIFIRRHAHAVAINNTVVILHLNILKGPTLFRKEINVCTDEKGLSTHVVTLHSMFNKLLYVLLPIHYLILKKYIAKNLLPQHGPFQAIHSHVIFPAGIVGHYLAKKIKCAHILTEHWTKIDKFFKVSAYRYFAKKAYSEALCITCVSQQLQQTIYKYVKTNNCVIVPNVIDASEFFPNKSIQKNDTLTFIAVANWAQFKNPFYFLNALQQLMEEKKLPTFKVILAGDGPYLEKVKAGGYSFSIEFPGKVQPAELNMLFNKSHVFLHGSDFETFSVVIAEALACGLPCVVSPVGIAPEVINDSNGCIALNDPQDWKKKILMCVNKQYNNQEIANAIKEKYSTTGVAQDFEKIYSVLM